MMSEMSVRSDHPARSRNSAKALFESKFLNAALSGKKALAKNTWQTTHADRVVMLYDKGIYADGTAAEVLTKENIELLYGIECEIMQIQGRPHIALLDGDELDSHIGEIYLDLKSGQ